MAKEKLSFEESVKRLDEIVKLLERGDAPLSRSLKLFEEEYGSHIQLRHSAQRSRAEGRKAQKRSGR